MFGFALKRFLMVIILLKLGSCACLNAQEVQVSDLTANDLSEVLGIHWWIVQLPGKLGPKDTVTTEFVSSDGKIIGGGCGFSSGDGQNKIGDKVRIFCWEDRVAQQANVMIKLKSGGAGTAPTKDYFKGAAIGGASNGAVMKVGDILLKFDSTKSPSFTGGNVLNDGQVGLRVSITQKK